jgi:hypothetical protein
MHTMNLIREHEGIEEWMCPECGRHMLVTWNPKFKRTILQAGDLSIGHSGFKNNLQLEDMADTSTGKNSSQDSAIKPIDESRLTPWSSWMDKSDFANLWSDGV